MKIQKQTDWMTYPSWYKLFNTQIRTQNSGVTVSNFMGFPLNETAFQSTEQMQKFLLGKKHIFLDSLKVIKVAILIGSPLEIFQCQYILIRNPLLRLLKRK